MSIETCPCGAIQLYTTAPHTAIDSHAGVPTSFEAAALDTSSYTLRIVRGAGTAPGRAKGALMSAFSEGESLDMVVGKFVEMESAAKLWTGWAAGRVASVAGPP